ncbi:MAG: hypothetical protein WAN72_03370 [Candidatus Acidiferrales bacterium]
MPHSCEPCSASEKFDWEIHFYQCLLLPHTELADQASKAAGILSERLRQAKSQVISAPEKEALDDAIHHLRLIQVQHLGYPATDGEMLRKPFRLPEHCELDQPSRDLTGRPKPLSELRNLWKVHAE